MSEKVLCCICGKKTKPDEKHSIKYDYKRYHHRFFALDDTNREPIPLEHEGYFCGKCYKIGVSHLFDNYYENTPVYDHYRFDYVFSIVQAYLASDRDGIFPSRIKTIKYVQSCLPSIVESDIKAIMQQCIDDYNREVAYLPQLRAEIKELLERVAETKDAYYGRMREIESEMKAFPQCYPIKVNWYIDYYGKDGSDFCFSQTYDSYLAVNKSKLVSYDGKIIRMSELNDNKFEDQILKSVLRGDYMKYKDAFLKEIERFGTISNVQRIPIARIKYFQLSGNVSYAFNVHGGGGSGGGVNVAGAVAGGMLFGAAGAIVGGQMGNEVKIDPIKTDIQKKDDRHLRLVYVDTKGEEISFNLPPSAYEVLCQLMPEKEYNTVLLQKQSAPAPSPARVTAASGGDSFEQIRKFKALLDEGIISQEEYKTKRKELLGL